MKSMLTLSNIIFAIIYVVLFFWIANTTITFHPFSFKCEHLGRAIGWLFLGVGIMFVTLSSYKQGVKDGVDGAKKEFFQAIDSAFGELPNSADTTEPDTTK